MALVPGPRHSAASTPALDEIGVSSSKALLLHSGVFWCVVCSFVVMETSVARGTAGCFRVVMLTV